MATTSSSTAGRELLLELKRHEGTGTLPPYNLKLVRQCLSDLQDSFQCLSQEVQAAGEKPSMASRPSMLWHHAGIQRQKRCLLAYHKIRIERLKDCAAEHPHMASTSFQDWSTNGPELDFLKSYQDLRQSYLAQAAGLPADLSLAALSPSMPPPSSSSANSLQVRCLKTLGQVVLESGRSVTLSKGSVLYLPRQDVLEFLQDGTMQLCDGEEVDF